MSKDLILLAAIGAAVVLVLKKQQTTAQSAAGMTVAQKQAAGLMPTKAQDITANVNGAMWATLLGDGWRNLVNAKNADGTRAFITNSFGQAATSDGKPIGTGNPIDDMVTAWTGTSATPDTPYYDMVTDYAVSGAKQTPLAWDLESY